MLLVHWRRQGRRWRESNTPTPTSAPPARARGRNPNVYFAMRRAQKHVGGVGAREAASRKTRRKTTREAGGRGTEVGVARACDEEDFRDCVTGEGMGCERESDCVLGRALPGDGDIRGDERCSLCRRPSYRARCTSRDLHMPLASRHRKTTHPVAWDDRLVAIHSPRAPPSPALGR